MTTEQPHIQLVNFGNHLKLRDFIEWFIIHAITTRDEKAKADGSFIRQMATERNAAGDVMMNIVFTVNGVSLPFEETILDLDKQLNRMILESAENLLNEKLRPTMDKLERIGADVRSLFERELGIQTREDD